jgi:uncharacterized protein (UPF0332 family)
MQPDDKNILIARWLEKSQDAMKVAEDNVANNHPESALNRIYYAIFYVVTALAQKEDFKTSKHASLMGWFNKKFVFENKVFEPKLFEVYKDASEYRLESDYDAMYKPDSEEVKELLANAKIFIEAVRKVI